MKKPFSIHDQRKILGRRESVRTYRPNDTCAARGHDFSSMSFPSRGEPRTAGANPEGSSRIAERPPRPGSFHRPMKPVETREVDFRVIQRPANLDAAFRAGQRLGRASQLPMPARPRPLVAQVRSTRTISELEIERCSRCQARKEVWSTVELKA